jgi:hypothetical protein
VLRMHLMQQIVNEVQIQCGRNNIALMQTKVTRKALSDMTFVRTSKATRDNTDECAAKHVVCIMYHKVFQRS